MKQAGCSSTDQGGGKRRDALKPDYLLTGGFGGAVGPVLFCPGGGGAFSSPGQTGYVFPFLSVLVPQLFGS
jgi:hypothetical protein